MDDTQSPGRDRRRRRTPKTNNAAPSSSTKSEPPMFSQSSQPPRTKGRNSGQARNRSYEQRSTTPEATPSASSNNNNNNNNNIIIMSTPRHKGLPAVKQAQVTELKFAGVFTNSPAASALPIPSFCIKPTAAQSPTPATHDVRDPLDSQDDSEDGTQSSSDADTHESDPGPASPVTTTTPAHVSVNLFASYRDESPLDRIFRADREEKQRALQQGSATSPRQKAPEPLAFTPIQLHREARVRNALSQTSPGMSDNNTPPSLYGGISPQELDGTPGRTMGPAFSTPYHQRMAQARQTSTATAVTTPPQSASRSAPAAPDSAADRSEALKRYLFGTPGKQSRATDETPKSQAIIQTPTKSPFESIYAGAQSPRSPDLLLMEDNLRRILNLSPALDSKQMHEQPTIYS